MGGRGYHISERKAHMKHIDDKSGGINREVDINGPTF